jgi:hypothetical protein
VSGEVETVVEDNEQPSEGREIDNELRVEKRH